MVTDSTSVSFFDNKVSMVTPALPPTVSDNPVLILRLSYNCYGVVWLVFWAVSISLIS